MGEAGRKQEWWGEPGLLFDITTIILLAGSDLVSPWLVSIQWPVITVPQEFPLYVPLSSALQPTTAGNLVKKPLRSTGWSGSFWLWAKSTWWEHMMMETELSRYFPFYVHFFRFLKVQHRCGHVLRHLQNAAFKGTVHPKIKEQTKQNLFFLLPVLFIHLDCFGDISRRDVCLLLNMMELNGTQQLSQRGRH